MPAHRALTRSGPTLHALFLALIAAPSLAVPLDLSEFHGRVVYLDFWASWCVPCRQSFPWMVALKRTYQAQGLTVVAINVDHDRAAADQFLQRFSPDFEVRFDPRGEWATQFEVTGMPTGLLIDRQGKVRFTHIGFWPADGAVSSEQIRQLLAEH